MRHSTKAFFLLPVLAWTALAGCDCTRKVETKGAAGDPVVVERQPDGTVVKVKETAIDFGPLLIGEKLTRTLTLSNDGRSAFQISAVSRVDPSDDAFRVAGFIPFELDVGESRDVTFAFEPSVEGNRLSDFSIDIQNATVSSLRVHLKGRAVKGGCVVEPEGTVQFGSVALGTSFVKLIAVKNTSDLDWKVKVGKIESQSDEGAFVFSSFAPGEYTVPAHDGVMIPIEFKPNHVGPFSASLFILSPRMCTPVVSMAGTAVDQVLTWDPPIVNFGYVNPNTRVTSKVTFKNIGNKDVNLSGLQVVNPPQKDQFSLDTTEVKYVVPKDGGTVEVPLAFKPTLLGTQSAKLNFLSDDAKLSTGTVPMSGFGGGPDIDASPAKVDFGPVAINTYQYRRITIANVGTDAPATLEDNLLLVEKDKTTGKWFEKKPVLIEKLPNKEFELDPVVQGYTKDGVAAGQNVDLRIKFTPRSSGLKEAKVLIYSNDPDEPVLEVAIMAGGKTMPPCDYEVIPPQLKFGNVESGKVMTLPFYIRNRATNPTEECLISTLGLARGTPSAFTLVKGNITGAIVPGGGQLEVPVKFAPKSDGSFTGAVEFYISSPTMPEGKVNLIAGAQPACLLVAPNDLDFGVVQTNCSSRDRSFTVYNVCPTTLTITAIDVQAGLSTEFRISQKPALPATLAAGASVDFKATYRPTDVGKDSGSIAVQTAQRPQPDVVIIAGRGDTTAVQTDVFAQDSQPKVDVLLVIDDSCSMMDKQQALSKNFSSFIKFAVSQQVDYHIAATTTSVCSSYPNCSSYESDYANGRFLPLSGVRPKVISPNTPNKEQVFSQNVNVGINGSGSEELIRGAYLALQSSALQGHNAGFLRDEAHLAIIVVSDAADQSPNTVAFYSNFFTNIKGFRRANMFSVSGIIPTLPNSPSGCSYDESSAGQSTRVRELITKTGGIYDDICTPDWAKTLEKLGQTAFGYRTRFFLSNLPDMSITPDPIVVKVDGQPYPAVGPRADVRWTYNSTANAIDFEPLAVPEPGSTLTITYRVQCLP